ncbi:MAG: hypothetical protein J6X34_01890 [Clostridia bacterium]|nr:hypothetical protein [Clostridia bacterium]
MMRFELKKNGSVFLVLVFALLCCAANVSLTVTTYSSCRDPLRTISEVARVSGDTHITEDFKRCYYELVVVPEIKIIQKETGKSASSYTGILKGSLKYENYPSLKAALEKKMASFDFLTEDEKTKGFATSIATILTNYDNAIFTQTGKQYFPEDRLTKFADGFAFLKGVVSIECFLLSTLAFVMVALNEKNSNSDTFEMFYSTRRGKKVYYVKTTEALIFSAVGSLIIVLGTSIFHYNYFDYAPFVRSSIDGPYFFTGYDSVNLLIPGLSFLHYCLVTLLFLILSLTVVLHLLTAAFVISQSEPIGVLIAAAAWAAVSLIWMATAMESNSFIKEAFPFPLFTSGNVILLKNATDPPLFNRSVISIVAAIVYLLATGALAVICLRRTGTKRK